MTEIVTRILDKLNSTKQALAILIDPDKFDVNKAEVLVAQLPTPTNFIFVGGSTATSTQTMACVNAMKLYSKLPVIIFPGHYEQICAQADAVLFLSLLSGENPEYLVSQQVASVKHLRETQLDIIPTAYILIDGGQKSSVERVSNTSAISQQEVERIVEIALAGQYMGKKLIYLEAGSGAKYPVSAEIISAVKKSCALPIIVGGGLRQSSQIEVAYKAGANLVVVGTAFEEQMS